MTNFTDEVKLNCVVKANSNSLVGTVIAHLNKSSEQKRAQIERGLGYFFYAEALLSQSVPLTREQEYFIQQSLQALESQASLIRQFFDSAPKKFVPRTTSTQPDKIPESVVQTVAEVHREYQSINTSIEERPDNDDDDDFIDDEIDFGSLGI